MAFIVSYTVIDDWDEERVEEDCDSYDEALEFAMSREPDAEAEITDDNGIVFFRNGVEVPLDEIAAQIEAMRNEEARREARRITWETAEEARLMSFYDTQDEREMAKIADIIGYEMNLDQARNALSRAGYTTKQDGCDLLVATESRVYTVSFLPRMVGRSW